MNGAWRVCIEDTFFGAAFQSSPSKLDSKRGVTISVRSNKKFPPNKRDLARSFIFIDQKRNRKTENGFITKSDRAARTKVEARVVRVSPGIKVSLIQLLVRYKYIDWYAKRKYSVISSVPLHVASHELTGWSWLDMTVHDIRPGSWHYRMICWSSTTWSWVSDLHYAAFNLISPMSSPKT